MKTRNFNFFIKEAITNILSNKSMSIASASIVFVTLYIFGIFFLFAANIENISVKVEDQPIYAFTIEKADLKVAQNAKKSIQKIDGVKDVTLITKEEGLKELKEKFDNYDDLFKGIDSDFLSYKLVIHIKDAKKAEKVINSIKSLSEIAKINYAQDTMKKVLKLTKIFRGLSYSLIIVLGFVSLFIIMYTIKLTVFSRRKEINIMKYVGATDWFIKWPFIIEGVIIGLLGSIFSAYFLFSSYGYLSNAFSGISVSIFNLVPLDNALKQEMFWMFLFVGTGIGSLGSSISVKKYLDV